MKILKVTDNQVFAGKKEYLKNYFGTGDIRPATIPRKKPWMIINQSNEIPRGWVIWSSKLYTNDSGYYNFLSEDGMIITEHIPEGEADYFQSCEEKDLRLMATRVVFTKAKNDGWRFKGVFVPDYEKTTSKIHVFKRIATEICITIEDTPVLEILE